MTATDIQAYMAHVGAAARAAAAAMATLESRQKPIACDRSA